MIADLIRAMSAGGLAAVCVCAYLEYLGVPGPVLVLVAGAIGAAIGALLARIIVDRDDDGHGYARRRRG